MDSRVTRRAMDDVRAVCTSASPVAATRWLTSLVTNLPEFARERSLTPADRAWARSGASFTTPSGTVVSLPAAYSLGAREIYCRNVYRRTGLAMSTKDWAVDLAPTAAGPGQRGQSLRDPLRLWRRADSDRPAPRYGFDVELRDNDGRPVTESSHQLSYLYRRLE